MLSTSVTFKTKFSNFGQFTRPEMFFSGLPRIFSERSSGKLVSANVSLI